MLKYFTTSLDAHLAGQPSKVTEVEIYKNFYVFKNAFIFMKVQRLRRIYILFQSSVI